jgi:pilus assembly protein FimV
VAAGAAAAGVAAMAAAQPRTDGAGQETYEDLLTAELSNLSDLDLGDTGIDMPELVTGAGNDWATADEGDLDFDLDLSAQGGADAAAVPGDGTSDESASSGTAELDDRLLDLEDAEGWGAPKPGGAKAPDMDDLDLQAADLDATLTLDSGGGDNEAGHPADALGRSGDGLDLTVDEAGELDLLTETVIMDGLEFGSGASSTSTVSLAMASLAMADNEAATKLDLARAYLDMGDEDGARTMLDEVLQEGTETQRHEAAVLVARLGQVSNL